MPRRPRIVIPQMPLHVIQRGNNRQACFFADEDYRRYLDWLREYAGELGCDIHAYVLMTNHVHLLLTPREADSVGRLMKRLGQRYVQYVNCVYQRSGTLWEGRFKSCLTQEEQYVLGCYRYIELNPVRAGVVEHPADYPWTSYRINAQNEKSELVTPRPLYLALGDGRDERTASYRDLFRSQMESALVDEIRVATNGNYVLGSRRFQDQVESMLKRRVRPGKAGRPRKCGYKLGSVPNLTEGERQ